MGQLRLEASEAVQKHPSQIGDPEPLSLQDIKLTPPRILLMLGVWGETICLNPLEVHIHFGEAYE